MSRSPSRLSPGVRYSRYPRRLIVMSMLILAGCASAPAIHNPAGLAESELARVTAGGGYFRFAQIAAVFDESGKRVVGTDSWIEQNRWEEVHLPQGKYQFVVYCFVDSKDAYPRVNAMLEGSQHYRAGCEPIKEETIFGLQAETKVRATIELNSDR